MKANMRLARRSLIVFTLSLVAHAFAAATLTGQTADRQTAIASVTVVDVRDGSFSRLEQARSGPAR